MRHGTRSYYTHKRCRCEACRDANRRYQSLHDSLRFRRLLDDETVVVHGSASTYVNWKCRCTACSAAHTTFLRDQFARQLAQMTANPQDKRHGTVSGYSYGCRCDLCRDARSTLDRTRYESKQ